ncbi:hypothetical protein K788_0002891 [Paraburkholderia caribensis MBA4]|uniref:Uncharacterized protein n=1 Tax=Paraburkholderia caribensis MBA4 TaxID=1323664 RepID=A0A0P0RCX1_9BURK|nr:hypothetical protein K788_0002891 [Paraburkholderia caribensis MBA4]
MFLLHPYPLLGLVIDVVACCRRAGCAFLLLCSCLQTRTALRLYRRMPGRSVNLGLTR